MAYSSRSRSGPIAQDSWPGAFGEARAASTAGGGSALNTTAALVNILPGTTHLSMITTNYTTAKVVKMAVNPYLLGLVTANGSTMVDNSAAMQGTAGGRALVLDALGVFPAALYVGSHLPFRGLAVTINQANAVASVLSGAYWNGTAWTALTGFSDGTASAGATMAIAGNITWTVPTTWATVQLPVANNTTGGLPPLQIPTLAPYQEKPRYWLQFQVSAALTNPTSASLVLPLNRSTAYSEYIAGSTVAGRMFKGPDGLSCVEALVDAGTANLVVNCFNDLSVGQF